GRRARVRGAGRRHAGGACRDREGGTVSARPGCNSTGARVKSVLTALLMGVPAVLQAAPLEDSYVAARDRYTATLDRLEKSGAPGGRVLAREKPALADLEQRLRRIIGAHAFKGFSAAGRINLGTLVSGYGHGTLDGLRYSSQRDKAQVIVST